MKKFKTVLSFELSNYIQNKTYMITTLVIVILVALGMCLPRVIDMSGFLGTDKSAASEEDDKKDAEDTRTYVLYDKSGSFKNLKDLEKSFPGTKWVRASNEQEVQSAIKDQKADAGFVVQSLTMYSHYVYNKDLDDMDMALFDELLAQLYRQSYCAEHNLNLEEVMQLVDVPVKSTEKVLGKDMNDSFLYCYVLVIVIFMLIILYCIMIATSVTNEKSNRSIEVLVTSTTPNSLIFGKVLAGTIASFLQAGIVLAVAIGGYALNRDAWGGILDVVLDIPGNVLAVFALFGIFGFIFYAFIYAAVGALCSKTEDINKSASGVQMVVMIVYFVVLLQMSNIDGTVMKVLSFLPVSSYSAMYIRVAMGKVAAWEIVVSFLILVVSAGGVGYIAARIYRMGILRYGNPISIRTALKSIRKHAAE